MWGNNLGLYALMLIVVGLYALFATLPFPFAPIVFGTLLCLLQILHRRAVSDILLVPLGLVVTGLVLAWALPGPCFAAIRPDSGGPCLTVLADMHNDPGTVIRVVVVLLTLIYVVRMLTVWVTAPFAWILRRAQG